MNLTIACILGYIVFQLLLAFFVSRRSRNESDFLVAGRSLGPWLATFAVFATWFGAETCIGATGEAYRHGLSGVVTDPFGYTLGILGMALLFAVPLWKRGLLTLADLFRNRYGSGVERAAAILMIPTSLLWAAAQVRAFGQVLDSAGGWGFYTAVTVAAAVVIVYTAVGGMWANAVTDLLQGIVMILGIFALANVLVGAGALEKFSALPAERLSFSAGRSPLEMLEILMVPILSTMAAQELASRVLAMRSPRLAFTATAGASAIYLLVGLVPVALGLIAIEYLPPNTDPEQVLSRFAQQQLTPALYLLFLGALVSAILSTLSGALLVAGSLAAHNIVMPLIRGGLSDARKLQMNRIAVVLFGITAWAIALSSESVYALVKEASSLGSTGILVLIVFGLWGEKLGGAASAYAALAMSLGVYLVDRFVVGLGYPYLWSLVAALGAYLALAMVRKTDVAPLPST